jgi:Lrp/AsnC family transcriptional regulator for asnA, asnC and gidA
LRRNSSPGYYDDNDRRIIALLRQDGRMANMQIARQLGLGEATVRRRLSRLLSSGALRVVAVPSPELAGFTVSAIIGVSCDLRYLEEIGSQVATFVETRYMGYSTGSFNLVIEAFFYSQQHLFDFLTKNLATLPGVNNTETSIILKVAKFSFEWELPPEAAPDQI